MTVAVTARSAGKVTLAVIGDKLLTTTTTDVEPGTAQASAHRRQRLGHRRLCARDAAPAARRGGEAHARPRHRRAWFAHRQGGAHARRRHGPADLHRPETTLRVPIKFDGLAPARRRASSSSAVDVGILNLTNYKAPAPDDYYLGQRKLSAEVRDLYGQLIDGMQGTAGQIRTGGDGGAASSRQPADAAAARALFRHRQRRRRRHCRGRIRHSRPSPAPCG